MKLLTLIVIVLTKVDTVDVITFDNKFNNNHHAIMRRSPLSY